MKTELKKTGWLLLSVAVATLGTTLSLSPPLKAAGKGVERPLGTGTINWSQGTIRVTGAGAPPEKGSAPQKRLMAQRAAQADAYRQLAEATSGVQVFSETVVKDFVTESDTIRLQVSAVIKGARVAGPARYLSDGSVELDLEMPVFGSDSLAQALNFGEAIQQKAASPYSMSGRLAYAFPALSPTAGDRVDAMRASKNDLWGELLRIAQGTSPYTGLIVDASGLGAEPAMGPFIIGAAKRIHPNNEIGVDPDLVVKQGPLHYVEDIDDAKTDTARVGPNPLVIEAKGAQGRPSTDILLDEAAAKKVLDTNKDAKFLEKLSVTVVI